MSTFSQFTGGGGGGIKSIQRGTITIPAHGISATATISSVNTAKSELRMLGGSAMDISGNICIVPRIQLTNSTTITAIATYNISSTSCSISWELTEWD